MLSNSKEEKLDPRVKRTRSLILRRLRRSPPEKGFQSVSVQDITEKAEINRATFLHISSINMPCSIVASNRCLGRKSKSGCWMPVITRREFEISYYYGL